MWHRLRNIINSLETYSILSPDCGVRRQVNDALRNRRSLDVDQWYEAYFKPYGISYAVVNFAYIQLEQYSGIQFSRVVPSDRLEEDLQWTQVCWFDWEVIMCEDFCTCFGIDIGDCIYDVSLDSIEAVVVFLDNQLRCKAR